MSIYNNKGQIIGATNASAEKLLNKEIAAFQTKIDEMASQLDSLKISQERVLSEVDSLRKTVEGFATNSSQSS